MRTIQINPAVSQAQATMLANAATSLTVNASVSYSSDTTIHHQWKWKSKGIHRKSHPSLGAYAKRFTARHAQYPEYGCQFCSSRPIFYCLLASLLIP